ncbi:hypothetical protein [uncultured Thomasclavelia sp.]|uniref:hypothetical protein n=1 Tax=uncultured Thomasclavelia sp. TaxID=3025759 RepID=UPI0025930579|nr:hypothetical protein [uncultured Thomasclavelia sp.]
MAKLFGENERRICSLFKKGEEIYFRNKTYIVLFAGKPTTEDGEPKTDIFIRTLEKDSINNFFDIKISYKQENADFIENKMTPERAEQILGKKWKSIIESSTNSIKDQFKIRPLIYTVKYNRTDKGAFTLGWKFELLRVKSGKLSGFMNLTYEQKVDVYAGKNLNIKKKNSYVLGNMILNSGIADFIFEESKHNKAVKAQDVIDNMLSIEDYLKIYPNIYFACKALNYRSFKNKYDGNRPLSVYVNWSIKNNKLSASIIFNNPLTIGGKSVYNNLMNVMNQLNISNTDDLNENNLDHSIPKI